MWYTREYYPAWNIYAIMYISRTVC
jgi:hypothetical protein